MQLTRQTDYALRLLIHLANLKGAQTSISDIAAAQRLSRTHLMKIANLLSNSGFLKATRGRGGGIALGRAPELITIADVVRATEPDSPLIDCTGCRQDSGCRLRRVLDQAEAAFSQVLARTTLADVSDPVAGPNSVYEQQYSNLKARSRH
ncbi:Rrf2 family transcriptional regulator [Novosphingobium sp. RD2P27]|uniref:Rrf2 family transcriptional regulator n=1 Tax=Novosphingobium kalidii TaxID=3230299 RepID=A0ABV2D1N5_9SPHN